MIVLLLLQRTYYIMQQQHKMAEILALQSLLAIEDPYEQTTSKDDKRTGKQNKYKIYFHQRQGKENMIRLPKVTSNKEELKSILKRLESTEVNRGEGRPLKVLKNTENIKSQTCGLKVPQLEKAQETSMTQKDKNSKSILDIVSSDDIKSLMRQKNYSTNALNLKTMHILQQINSKNCRNYSLSLKNQEKSHKKQVIAFLRKAG